MRGVKLARARLALRASPRAEARYVRDLRAITEGIAEGTMKTLEPELAHRASRADELVSKHGEKMRRVIGGLRVHVSRHVGDAFDRMAVEVDKRNRKGMAVLGIQPGASGLSPVVAAARDENIRLIANVARAYADQVRAVLEDPETVGLRVDALSQLLEERADVATSRAELIARDQTLKLNSALTRERHVRAGVTSYSWSTSRDERVRPLHAELEGETFGWDDPPVTNEAGETNAPGEDFQCRCVPIPAFETDDEPSPEE